MATGGSDLAMERFRNEQKKEKHRRITEYFGFGLIAAITIGCAAAVAAPTTTKRSENGKTETVSGPDESTKSWAKTILTSIAGAAVGYSMKQAPKPTPS